MPPSEATVEAWVRLLRAHRVAFGGVESALKTAGLPPLAWYDALLELERVPTGLRANELEARMLLPQYNISRLVDRLETAGHLAKRVAPDDARGRLLTLTPAGRSLRRRMWPVYRRAIEDCFGARLSEEDARNLSRLLGQIAHGGPGRSQAGPQ